VSSSRLGPKDFPDRQPIFGAEGGVVYYATRLGKFYVIVDESALADLLGEDDIGPAEALVHIYEFATEAARKAYVRKRGWTSAAQRPNWPPDRTHN